MLVGLSRYLRTPPAPAWPPTPRRYCREIASSDLLLLLIVTGSRDRPAMLPVPEQAHLPPARLEDVHRRHREVLLQDDQLCAGVEVDHVSGKGADVDDVANHAQRRDFVRLRSFVGPAEPNFFRPH